ncbi:MAG: exopolysaccharide biosynthesis protein [Caulobacterales bacterium]|nr:exopolysaccharide biosynthesis protein [Caulobacterales bacterium]
MDPVERRRPLSELLADIGDDPDPQVTVGEIVHRLGRRSFGALLFVFSAPNWLPLPPGSSTFLALPLLLLAPQIALGIRGPWLPGFVDRRTLKRADLANGLNKLIPTLRKIEKVSRPRLTFLFGPLGDRLIGLTVTLLSLVLLLPIFLGNMAPAAAIAAFGLALVQRDGILALIGYAIAGVSVGLLVVGWQVAAAFIGHILRVAGLS